MSKYSQEVIDDLIEHLDPLDVMELIDYHPESFQREGTVLHSLCPLCQDHSGSYLRVDLDTGNFESTPPGGPEQRGNLIDLFARYKRVPFDQAMEELANEFGILLVEASSKGQLETVYTDAMAYLERAQKEPAERDKHLDEVDKRIRRLLELEPENSKAREAEFQLRLLQKNQITAGTAAAKLLENYRTSADVKGVLGMLARVQATFPEDLVMRQRIAFTLGELGAREEAIEELMGLADLAEQAAQPNVALSAYRKVREIGAELVDVHPMIISLLLARNKKEEAATELARHVEFLKAEKRYKEAFEQGLEKLSLTPGDHAMKVQVVELAVLAGLDEGAMENCLELIDGMIEEGTLQEAAHALGSIVAEQPENITVLEQMISVYQRLGEKELVHDLQFRLAELYRRSDDASGAMMILEGLLAESPDDVQVLRSLADLLEQSVSMNDALPHLKKLARLLTVTGEFKEALTVTDKLIAAGARETDLRALHVHLLFQLGQREHAVKEALRLAGDLDAAGHLPQAVIVLKQVVQEEPGSIPGRLALAMLHRKAGNTADAEAVLLKLTGKVATKDEFLRTEGSLKELVVQNPESAHSQEVLAHFYTNNDRPNDARDAWLRAARLHKMKGRMAEERAALEWVSGLGEMDEKLLLRLADTYGETGDQAGAVSVAEKLMDLYLAEKKYEQVITQANRIIEFQSEHRSAYRILAEAWEHLGDKAKALKVRAEFAAVLRALPGHEAEEAEVLRLIIAADPTRVDSQERLVNLLLKQEPGAELMERINSILVLNKKNEEKSVRFLKDILKDHPHLVEVRRRLALLYNALGRTDEMVAEMQTLADQLEADGRADEAIALYEKLLNDAPESISTRAGLVAMLKRLNRNAEAVVHYFHLARALTKAGRHRESIQAWNELAELDPDSEEAYRGHAATLRAMGMDMEAIVKMRDLAGLFGRQGRSEKAIAVLTELLEEDPVNLDVRREIARLRKEGGQIAQAAEELGKLAQLLRDSGDEDGAISTRREAITLQPDSPELRLGLIKHLHEADRKTEAQTETLDLALVYAKAGRPEKGLAQLEAVLKETPSNIQARRIRARIFDEMGDEKRALAEYREMQLHLESVTLGAATLTPLPVGENDYYPQLDIMEEYDFESFVVGTKNNFAFATARAVAEHPGSARNPLFLHSDAGLGKTHLLHAIANYLKAKRPEMRIIYTSTEYFTTELVDAIQNNTVTAFRNRHQQADVLLLDDVQFLAQKERAQEEFFHIFNMLFQKQKQIVVTSDRPPKDIAHLNMRLRSRFGQGVIVDIQSPDLETRIAILQTEAQRKKIKVDVGVLQLLAERVVQNVRELKGAFNQLVAMHEIDKQKITVELANSIVDKYFS